MEITSKPYLLLFSPVEINGKLFANPGSMTRTKADVKEIARKPKVLLIEVKDGKVTLEERELTSAPDGEKVLDRTSILKRQANTSKIESIKSIVNKAKLSKGQSVTDIIESVADAEAIDEAVTDDVIARVTDKMEDMGHSETADVSEYKLSQIVLENFQSHKHSVFDVSDKLNIFTGESSNGKSAIMRAMRWLMDNHGRSQRESFIRHGADYAKVTAVFDDGKMISRVIHSKAHRDNGWEIFDPLTAETHAGNTQMLDEVREHFGFTKVKYDVKDELDINFMNQGDGWYFIGDHVTASKRAKIIGAIFGTHYTDAVMRDLEKELRNIKQEVKVREEDLDKTQKRIEEFTYLDEVEAKLTQVEKMVNELQTLETQKEAIQTLIDKKAKLNQQENHLKQTLDRLKGLDKASDKMSELESMNVQYGRITDILDRRTRIIKEGKEQRALTEKLKRIDEVSQQFEVLQNKHETYVQLSELLNQSNTVSRELNKTKKTLKSLENVDSVKEKVKRLEALGAKHEQLSKQILQEQDVSKRMKDGRQFMKENDKKLKRLQSEYKELLDDYGYCPTCGQTVCDDVLDGHLVHAHSH